MTLYELREAIRTETNEARLTELIIERDRLVAEENANRKPVADFHTAMLDATYN